MQNGLCFTLSGSIKACFSSSPATLFRLLGIYWYNFTHLKRSESMCWLKIEFWALKFNLEAIYNSIGNYSSFESAPSSNDTRKKPWRKRRTTLKVNFMSFISQISVLRYHFESVRAILIVIIQVRNLDSNHRSQDIITLPDQAVELVGRFVYGPFDFTCLRYVCRLFE